MPKDDVPDNFVWMVPEDLAEQVGEWATARGLSRSAALDELVKIGLSSGPVLGGHPSHWLGKPGRA